MLLAFHLAARCRHRWGFLLLVYKRCLIREFSVCGVEVLSFAADGLNAALFDQHFSLLVHLFQYAVDGSVPRRWESLG